MELSSKAKKKLRAAAHSIKPSIIIGKEGASRRSIDSIDKILDIKELIKIKFNSHKDEKIKIIDTLLWSYLQSLTKKRVMMVEY